MFDLQQLAEWTAAWAPAPVAITEVACGGCGRAGVRLVKEGETVDGEAINCETCGGGVPRSKSSANHNRQVLSLRLDQPEAHGRKPDHDPPLRS